MFKALIIDEGGTMSFKNIYQNLVLQFPADPFLEVIKADVTSGFGDVFFLFQGAEKPIKVNFFIEFLNYPVFIWLFTSTLRFFYHVFRF
jgi:hypothetical protein